MDFEETPQDAVGHAEQREKIERTWRAKALANSLFPPRFPADGHFTVPSMAECVALNVTPVAWYDGSEKGFTRNGEPITREEYAMAWRISANGLVYLSGVVAGIGR